MAPAEEIVEAYFNGKAMLLPPHGWGGVKDEIVYSYPTGGTAVYACPKPIIGVRISGNAKKVKVEDEYYDFAKDEDGSEITALIMRYANYT